MKFVRFLGSIIDVIFAIPVLLIVTLYLNVVILICGIKYKESPSQILKSSYETTKEYIKIYPKVIALVFKNFNNAVSEVFL